MTNKPLTFYLMVVSGCLLTTVSLADLSTLFTTPTERQMIDSHRYQLQPTERAVSKVVKPERMQKSFNINGITVSNEGRYRVWINHQTYQDGERIDGKSQIKIMVGNEIKVRITAPDGKNYFGGSGETVKISYSGDL